MLSLPVTQTNYGSKKVILRYEQKLGLYLGIHRQTGRAKPASQNFGIWQPAGGRIESL
jgi:hypothetical protein